MFELADPSGARRLRLLGIVLAVFGSSVPTAVASAQDPDWCGVTQTQNTVSPCNEYPPMTALVLSDEPLVLRLKLLVVARSDGTGGLSAAHVDTLRQGLIDYYAPGNIGFDIETEPVHDDSAFLLMEATQPGYWAPSQFDPAYVTMVLGPHLTSFGSEPMTGSGGSEFTDYPPNCSGGGVGGWVKGPRHWVTPAAAHELGHSLGLGHTFGQMGQGTDYPVGHPSEPPGGTDCSTHGDLICDTPEDPAASQYVTSDCQYAPPQHPYFTTYDPDLSNIMGYYWNLYQSGAYHACVNDAHFTPGQFQRMRATILSVPSFEAKVVRPIIRPFTNLSLESGVSLPQGSSPYAAVPFDYNEDRAEDLLVSFSDRDASLNENTGAILDAARFEDRRLELLPAGITNTLGATTADFNGDGNVDVFIASAASQTDNYLLTWNGTDFKGPESDLSSLLGPARTLDAESAAFGDFNGDRWLDLFVLSDSSGTGNLLLQSQAGTGFVDVTDTAGIRTGVTRSTWADLDLDGRLDLLVGWGDPVGPNGAWTAYYHNQGPAPGTGQTTFVDVAGFAGSPRIGQFGQVHSIVTADVSGDRKLDVLMASADGLIACINDGGGVFSESAGAALGLSTPTSLVDVEVLDLEADAIPDVVGVPLTGGDPVVVWYGRGDFSTRRFLDASSIAGLGSVLAHGAAAADFNGDTDVDLLLLRPATGPGAEGNQYFWANRLVQGPEPPTPPVAFTVELVPWSSSTNPNTMGIGATVGVKVIPPTGPVLYTSQVIDGGGGRASQGTRRPGFGLAGASTAEITVRWPHGQTQVFDAASSPGFPAVRLTDSSDPLILEATIVASTTPGSGYSLHTYRWKTVHPSDQAQVLVEVGPRASAECRTPLGGGTQRLLAPGMAGVSTTTEQEGGQWTHTVTWIAYCWAPCTYTYTVRNVVGGQVYSGAPKTLGVQVCAEVTQ